ncbi:GntR family transcriptional regulator [Corynebacterium sp. MSK006]|uniref:GntR family transcriptional regulator n=1 Tax=Corynebacterium sp. MSK006 TaxID=3050187 RepID=UPI00254F5079|nr:GntR family transcriptional regulator [Corynebacterium sp. MSK006]MDK8894121.1 GntR family transcriptional regulator [Corynebacterium sp. MSK006]
MIIRTDPSDPTPIYRQIALQTAAQIRDGTLARGERLPTAAQLARSLEVNRNTTLQAYRLLRDEGLIDLRRGRGAVVRAAAPAPARDAAPTPAPSPSPTPPDSPTDPDLDALAARMADAALAADASLDDVVHLLHRKGLS